MTRNIIGEAPVFDYRSPSSLADAADAYAETGFAVLDRVYQPRLAEVLAQNYQRVFPAGSFRHTTHISPGVEVAQASKIQDQKSVRDLRGAIVNAGYALGAQVEPIYPDGHLQPSPDLTRTARDELVVQAPGKVIVRREHQNHAALAATTVRGLGEISLFRNPEGQAGDLETNDTFLGHARLKPGRVVFLDASSVRFAEVARPSKAGFARGKWNLLYLVSNEPSNPATVKSNSHPTLASETF